MLKPGDLVLSPGHDRGRVIAVTRSGRGWRQSSCVTVRFADGSTDQYLPEDLIPFVPSQPRPRVIGPDAKGCPGEDGR